MVNKILLFFIILNKNIDVNVYFSLPEPGYYEDGEFGIRIEDIVQIVPANIKANFTGRGALTFKTITMCPIQTKLVDATLLTEKEVFCGYQ